MTLDTDLLRKKLKEMLDIHNIKASKITTEAKVHNIRRMVDGRNEPYLDSWQKLHKAFPEYIPPPTMKG